MLNDWISTLTRVEFSNPDPSGPSPSSNGSSLSVDALRANRDRLLLQAVSHREKLETLLNKCSRLQLKVSTLKADRLAAVRRANERTMIEEEKNSNRRSLSANAGATSALSSFDAAASSRHGANILLSRANAERRAVKRIQSVKRRYAKQLEQERAERRTKAEKEYQQRIGLSQSASQQELPPHQPIQELTEII